MKLDHARLLVDRYMRAVAPDSDALGKSFGMEVIATLAYSPEVRLNAKNQGVSLFELAPREALRKACAPRRTPGQALRKPGQAQVLASPFGATDERRKTVRRDAAQAGNTDPKA
jgi:pilus assembly protein CpaE